LSENLSDKISVEAVLGSEGSISRRLSNYESRPQQIDMANAVESAIRDESHLVVEAGTGVGKSFGYLVPAILAITDPEFRKANSKKTGEERHGRLVVSTHTISLQEQLMSKDLPLLNSVIPREFSAVLAKGRGNYLSKRRLANAVKRQVSLFSSSADVDQLGEVYRWEKESGDGSLATLPFRPSAPVWEAVSSDTSNCLSRKCEFYNDCHYFAARRRVSKAQVIVVNHALFFTDLALRREGVKLLPDYDAVILDEAHTMESVAASHLGFGVTNAQIRYRLTRLYNQRTLKGLLAGKQFRSLQQEVCEVDLAADDFFETVMMWASHHRPKNESTAGSWSMRVRDSGIAPEKLCYGLSRLAGRLKAIASKENDVSVRKDFQSAHDGLISISTNLKNWLFQAESGSVYWIETRQRQSGQLISLMAAPIDIGQVLKSSLFSTTPSVVMASATLAVGQKKQDENQNFEFFTSRVGVTKHRSARLGSPFNYKEQAELVVVPDMPGPDEGQKFDQACAKAVEHFAGNHGGRTFVLFTSYGALRRVQQLVMPWLRRQRMEIFSQGDQIPRTQLIERFRANPRSVLFGTDSFWQGVDVPGDALTNVMITKLPFSVPDHPLLEAKLEAIREAGGNPFSSYQLPEAVIKLKQGFGRLIRTAKDYGQVVILDPRVKTKYYGRLFLQSLPDAPVVSRPMATWTR